MSADVQEKYQRERKKRIKEYMLQPLSLLGGGVVLVLSLILALASGPIAGLVGLFFLSLLYVGIFYSKASSGAKEKVLSEWAAANGWVYESKMSSPGGSVFLIADKQEYSDSFTSINIQGYPARLFNLRSIIFYSKGGSRFSKKDGEKEGQEQIACIALQIDMPYRLPLRSLLFQPRLLSDQLPALQERMAQMFSERQPINLGLPEVDSVYQILVDREDHPGYAASVLDTDFVSALLANPHPFHIIQYENGRLTLLLLNDSIRADSLESANWLLARGQQILSPLSHWAHRQTAQAQRQAQPQAPEPQAPEPQAPQAPPRAQPASSPPQAPRSPQTPSPPASPHQAQPQVPQTPSSPAPPPQAPRPPQVPPRGA